MAQQAPGGALEIRPGARGTGELQSLTELLTQAQILPRQNHGIHGFQWNLAVWTPGMAAVTIVSVVRAVATVSGMVSSRFGYAPARAHNFGSSTRVRNRRQDRVEAHYPAGSPFGIGCGSRGQNPEIFDVLGNFSTSYSTVRKVETVLFNFLHSHPRETLAKRISSLIPVVGDALGT